MNAPEALAPTAADRPAHAASPAHASDELRAALSEAGLHAPVTGGAADADVRIGPLAPADARQLARLIRTGTKRTLKTTRALREICAGHRIELPWSPRAPGPHHPRARPRRGRGSPGPGPRCGAAARRPARPGRRDRRRLRGGPAQPRLPGGHRRRRPLRMRTGRSPGLLDLGAIDARTARRLVRALRF